MNCFRYKRNAEKDNHVLLKSETGNLLILPFTHIYQRNFSQPVTLREICLRVVYSLFYETVDSCRSRTDFSQLLQVLPETIQNELTLGPTAICQHCKHYLFKYTWIKMFEIQVLDVSSNDHRVELVQYFCCSFCLKSFNNDYNNNEFLHNYFKLNEKKWNYV